MSVVPVFAPGCICTPDPTPVKIEVAILNVEEIVSEVAFGPFARYALAVQLLHDVADNLWSVAQVDARVQLFAQISLSFDRFFALIAA